MDVFDGEKLCKAAAEGNVEEVIQQLAGDGVADKLKDNPTSSVTNQVNGLTSSTALLEACFNQHPKVVEAILKYVPCKEYIDFQEESYGMTALMIATYTANEEIVKMMLEAKADPDVREKEGKSAIWFAKDDPDMKEILLAHGASPEGQKT